VAGEGNRQSVRRGVLLVISSPSGAGKTTLSRNLLEAEKNIAMSVSVTTRPRRQSEIEGSHYFFKSVSEFAFMRDSGQLLEWAEVHGNFYGTPRDAVMKALAQGQDVLFDIDVQGTHQLAAAMPEDVVRVFVLPPSIDEMRSRLKRRAEDDDATIIRRLRTAETELRHWDDYDYVIVNDDLDRSFSELRAILDAERLRRVRRPAIKRLVEQLQHDLAAVVAAN
jgi:guanylate kinase